MQRILIWGTGTIAKEVINNSLNGEVIGFVETYKKTDNFMDKPIYGIDEIPVACDYVVVANTYVNEIYRECTKRNIDINKFIFIKGVKTQLGCTNIEIIREILGEKNYTNYCAEFSITEHTFFEDDKKRYDELNTRENFKIQRQYLWPIMYDKYAMAGTMSNYFWQDLWAAKLIYKSGIKKHFDIGSRIDGFIAHLLAMDIEVSIIDIREFPGEVENLHTIVDDATSLKQVEDNSIESMSALCSLEHFGLGRYGDPIDPESCFKCFAEIQKKIKKSGHLYIALPIGKEKVEFNAHRVFYATTVIECFNELTLKEFSCAANEKIEYNVDLQKYDEDNHNGEYRYGLFHFVKE
ncbi:MAG: DUF268 domain-containing protein [Alphaproteobacteria bacterium]|nr:DUF268 domain-containing protein [Alphaproteobacteria bacterium]MBQ6888570.1 DUF268 domain-containing protein [Lachnospiraceae bacterium]